MMASKISPLAPKQIPDMPALNGVRMATAKAGIKYQGRTDLLFMTAGTMTSQILGETNKEILNSNTEKDLQEH